MRVGVLATGGPPEALTAKYGSYADMVARFLTPENNGGVEFRYYEARHGELPESARACDAYVLTGSACSVYDDLDWIDQTEKFCLSAHQRGAYLLGICFGHQLLARCFGGTVEKASQGWGVGIHTYSVKEKADWMQPELSQFSSIALHQDQVTAPPAEARILAASEFCPYAMMTIGERVLSLQSHPEMTTAYADELYLARKPVLGEELSEQARESLVRGHDHDLLGRWARRFLRL